MQDVRLQKLRDEFTKKRPPFAIGDKVSVSVRLKEGEKERVQVFRGVVITKQPKSGNGPEATFTVRKISEGVGVERIFPVHSPIIEKIEVESSADVRRSRLYYLRHLEGKKARLKESERFGELLVKEQTPEPQLNASQVETAQAPTSAVPAPNTRQDQTPKPETKKNK